MSETPKKVRESDDIVSKVKLAPQEQWEYSTKYWVQVLLVLCKTLAQDMGLGWGVVNRALAKSAREGWPEALKPVEKLGIQYKDARVWGSTEAFAGVNAWPGYTDEITEYTPQKTAILGCGPGTGGRCVVLDIATRLNLDKKVDLLTWCSTNSDAYLRKLSPHLRFIQLKGMCRGDPYDYGYAELVKNKVAGYKHSHENVKPFDDFKKSKSHP